MSKVTQYAALASAASNDELLIVDVDDLSMAATGTDKNITVTALAASALGTILTTAGDLLIENATPAPARLAVGAAGGAAGDFLGISGGLPAWQQVSGQYLCAPTSYAPGSRTSLAISTTTFAAVSSANINTGSFTAPASGSVIVTANLTANISTSGDTLAFGLAAHGTVTPMIGNAVIIGCPQPYVLPFSVSFLVTGLTAGTSYNFDLLACCQSGQTANVYAWGQSTTTPTLTSGGGSPVVMTVQAV